MRRIIYIFLVVLHTVNVAYSQETPLPYPSPVEGEGKVEGAETPPESQEEKTGEKVQVPVSETTIAPAEEELTILKAEITPGFQAVNLDRDSSKAREYRTLPEGLYIDKFLFYYASRKQEFGGEFRRVYPLANLIEDGYGDLDYRRYGLLDIDLSIAGFPHNFANDAGTIFHLDNPFTYTILQPRPIVPPFDVSPFDVSTQRDTYDLTFKFTPGDRLTISTNLSVEDRRGKRPLTMESFTEPPVIKPTAIIEIAEPSNYNTTAIDLGMKYLDDAVDLQLNNTIQVFSNNLRDEVRWDNPYIDGGTGKAKVADNHTVHTLSLRPAIKFMDNLRLINNLSYSKVTSSIDIVPLTTVSGVGEEFLRDVVDSDVRSLTFSSILSTRPLSDMRLNIKYRYNAYRNDTPKIVETPAYVMLDGGTNAIRYVRFPRYMSYYTKSIGLDGTWSLTNRLFLNSGIENRDTSRGEREVEKENEKRFSISLHTTISDKLSGRFGYKYTTRKGDYDPTYYNTDYDPGSDVSQHPLMRSFDLSSLDSNTITGSIDYFPVENLTLGSTLSLIINEHPEVLRGRKRSQQESVSINAQYLLRRGLLLYSEFFYDHRGIEGSYTWTFDSDLPYPQDPEYPGFTRPVTGTIEDTTNVYVAGFNYGLNKGLSINGKYSRYDSRGRSISLPEVSSMADIYELNTSYRPGIEAYTLSSPVLTIKDIKINAGYYVEIYRRDDYALDADYGTSTDIFLGIREPEYRMSVFSMSVSLYF